MAELQKRAESLAVENVKRIADVLRSERNDAIALAQVRREELEQHKKLLMEARHLLEAAQATVPEDLGGKIRAFIIALPPAKAG